MHHMHAVTTQAAVIKPVSDTVYPLGDVQVAGIEETFAWLTAGHHHSIRATFERVHQLQRIDPSGARHLYDSSMRSLGC